ncbi:cytidine/deoxycytidylate deaminase family protein isoform X2 [Carex rostrata]
MVSGKVKLSIILYVSSENGSSIDAAPSGVRQLIDNYNLSLFVTKVSRCQATSKGEWEEQCKLWPTSFHPPANPEGVSGLDEKDIKSIYSSMRSVIELVQSNIRHKMRNVAIIVDPSNGQIISKARDEILPLLRSSEENDSSNSSNEETKSKWSENKGVACVNPWGWLEQSCHYHGVMPCESGFTWHPLKHAAIVAIENAAARDRQLFPNPSPCGNTCYSEFYSVDGPAKRLKTENEAPLTKKDSESVSDLPWEATRPYLCTGFDIYLAWEPCPMCAMALVHQRIKRIFYAFPNLRVGALGSVHRLHGQKSLNHHYSVFRILIPDEALSEIFLENPNH